MDHTKGLKLRCQTCKINNSCMLYVVCYIIFANTIMIEVLVNLVSDNTDDMPNDNDVQPTTQTRHL